MTARRPLVACCLLLLAHHPADAGPFSPTWSIPTASQTVSQWCPQTADLNGDGISELVTIELTGDPGPYGRLCIRPLDTGARRFASDPFQADRVLTLDLVDVDGDGRLDAVMKGEVTYPIAGDPSLFVFGWNGDDYVLKDTFAMPSPIQDHYWAQLFADAPLELVALKAHSTPDPYGAFQVHRFGVPGVYVSDTPVLSTETPVVQFVDADGNGVQEMLCGQAGRLMLYATADAYVGVPAPTGAVTGGLALSRAWPNPARKAVQLGFAMDAAGDATLRVIDAAGRAVRTEQRRGLAAGAHGWQWDGRDDGGRTLSSGVYWLEVDANGERGSRRVVRLR